MNINNEKNNFKFYYFIIYLKKILIKKKHFRRKKKRNQNNNFIYKIETWQLLNCPLYFRSKNSQVKIIFLIKKN